MCEEAGEHPTGCLRTTEGVDAVARVFALICGGVAVLLAVPPPVGVAGGPAVAVEDVAHTVDAGGLVVSGWVRNVGRRPVRGLVVDVAGFAPGGGLAAFGSDGIPWAIPPGGTERFEARLPLGQVLIRDYVVRVSTADVPPAVLAEARRTVALALYRPLLLVRVRVAGRVGPGEVVLTSETGRLPVAAVIAEATVVIVHPKVAVLQRLTVAVPPNGRRVLTLGGRDLVLVDVRVVDLVLASNWDQ